MMPEISLNVLDIVQNSISAKADLIHIIVTIDDKNSTITVSIEDNGVGMSKDQQDAVIDPFYTTRTTRRVGLGIPFFRSAALITGGTFDISSTLGKGTLIVASFQSSHIDCMPLGDITSTIYSLIITNETIDFVYTYTKNDKSFTLDTREFRKILGDVSFSTFEVSSFIKNYLSENKDEVDS